jgi:hypothetical protein
MGGMKRLSVSANNRDDLGADRRAGLQLVCYAGRVGVASLLNDELLRLN